MNHTIPIALLVRTHITAYDSILSSISFHWFESFSCFDIHRHRHVRNGECVCVRTVIVRSQCDAKNAIKNAIRKGQASLILSMISWRINRNISFRLWWQRPTANAIESLRTNSFVRLRLCVNAIIRSIRSRLNFESKTKRKTKKKRFYGSYYIVSASRILCAVCCWYWWRRRRWWVNEPSFLVITVTHSHEDAKKTEHYWMIRQGHRWQWLMKLLSLHYQPSSHTVFSQSIRLSHIIVIVLLVAERITIAAFALRLRIHPYTPYTPSMHFVQVQSVQRRKSSMHHSSLFIYQQEINLVKRVVIISGDLTSNIVACLCQFFQFIKMHTPWRIWWWSVAVCSGTS